jgi:hypothetical protein
VRVERVVLEHHGDVALRRIEVGYIAPIDQDTARRGPLQPSNQTQQRRLAATRCADDDQHFAIRERQIDAMQYVDQAEALAESVQFQLRHSDKLPSWRS